MMYLVGKYMFSAPLTVTCSAAAASTILLTSIPIIPSIITSIIMSTPMIVYKVTKESAQSAYSVTHKTSTYINRIIRPQSNNDAPLFAWTEYDYKEFRVLCLDGDLVE